MIRKSLVALLVLFLVFTGVSWGIERVEKRENQHGLFLYVESGWTTLTKSSSFNGFCWGLGIGGRISRHFIGKFGYGYYQYNHNWREDGIKWTGKVFEYSLSLKANLIDISKNPPLNPYVGFGTGLLYAVSQYDGRTAEYYPWTDQKNSGFLMGLDFFAGCDFNLSEKEFLSLGGGLLTGGRLAKEYELETAWGFITDDPFAVTDWRVFIGFGHKL